MTRCFSVIPAKAGILIYYTTEIPAFAGMIVILLHFPADSLNFVGNGFCSLNANHN